MILDVYCDAQKTGEAGGSPARGLGAHPGLFVLLFRHVPQLCLEAAKRNILEGFHRIQVGTQFPTSQEASHGEQSSLQNDENK